MASAAVVSLRRLLRRRLRALVFGGAGPTGHAWLRPHRALAPARVGRIVSPGVSSILPSADGAGRHRYPSKVRVSRMVIRAADCAGARLASTAITATTPSQPAAPGQEK